ncbi:MAG: BatD family protein [Candidatus Eisenbacteria bacterium]|nr:BatD family protein [Candidatus Eisenbacteria bacterium]
MKRRPDGQHAAWSSGIVWMVVLLAAALFVTDTACAETSDGVILRTSIGTEGELWLGQRVTLNVDVLADEGWAQIVKFHELQASGVIIVRFETQGTRHSDSVGGRSYSGQRYSFSVFPQTGGSITIPSVLVDVETKTWGADGGTETARLKTPPVSFTVRVPPGAENLSGLVSTSSLTASQRWEPEPDSLKTGFALTRTVSVAASDVSGMAFPPLDHREIEGVGIYPGEPTLQDEFARGSLSGSREDVVTYVFEREGSATLPDVVVHWWNTETKTLREIRLPGMTLEIAPGVPVVAEAEEAAAGDTGGQRTRDWLPATVAAALAGLLALILWRRFLGPRWTAWRQARRESEAAHFRRFVVVARSGAAAATYDSLMRWLERLYGGSASPRLDVFLTEYGEESVRREAAGLERAAADGTRWEAKGLIRGMESARGRWRAARRRVAGRERGLPPLNPGGG